MIHEHGSNLMFEPVPLEFIYTDATKPQVLVTVNNIAGVCPEFNCDYLYVNPVGEITEQSLSADNVVTVRGTNLPTENVTVRLANSVCNEVTASEDEITCTLNVGAAAGEWDVLITDVNGLTPKESSVPKIQVGLNNIDVNPKTGLN